MAARGGEFREQDGQAVFSSRESQRVTKHARAQRQWNKRAPPAYQDLFVQYAWREATPINGYGSDKYARLHEPSGMIILARWGFLTSAWPAEWDREDTRANHGDAETVQSNR